LEKNSATTTTTEENLAVLSESLRRDELLVSKGEKISLFVQKHWRFVLELFRSIDFSEAIDSIRQRVENLLEQVESDQGEAISGEI